MFETLKGLSHQIGSLIKVIVIIRYATYANTWQSYCNFETSKSFPFFYFFISYPSNLTPFSHLFHFESKIHTISSQYSKRLPIFQIWISNSPLPISPSDRLPFHPLLPPSMAAPADRLRPVVKFSGQGIRFDDDDSTQTRPLLSRMLTYPIGIFHHQLRRRLGVGKPQVPRRQQSFSRDFGHAAAETFLITRLSFTLLRSLG